MQVREWVEELEAEEEVELGLDRPGWLYEAFRPSL